MQLIGKRLVRNEDDVIRIIKDWNRCRFFHDLTIQSFLDYPAVLCYEESDIDEESLFRSYIYYSITYISDYDIN